MEQLRIRAERFRKQSRLQEEDLKQIIEEMKADIQTKGGEEVEGETLSDDEHKRVMEAVEEGLLQTHSIAPNSMQAGIFRVLCKNANGFNNRISGNQKVAKALDIKDNLDVDCLLYCKHCLNLRHKSNVNDFKQMFQREIACTAIASH